jgi:uncharacterized protein
VLEIDTNQLVILTELMLRGPQTIGELRGRASRMAASIGESTEIVKNILDSLMNPGEGKTPMVRELPPARGSGDRAVRYAQLLCPDLHPLDAPSPMASRPDALSKASDSSLVTRIENLEQEVAQLRAAVQRMAHSLGEANVMQSAD